MPRQSDNKNTIYGPFFTAPTNTLDRHIAEAEKEQVRRKAIATLEHCQELIEKRQAKKDRVEQLLKENNFSSNDRREQAENLLKSLTVELKERRAEVANLIESRPSLQAHFSSPQP